jgi:2-polyprenyl-3-methyl-5-hydroxy-6-metoxy-1,4-benzoquinol methylase
LAGDRRPGRARKALLAIAVSAALLGLGATGFWFARALERHALDYLAQKSPSLLLGLAVTALLTSLNIALRWLRWHFLIRRVGAYVGTKDSLLIYLSTLPAIITPFYIGELMRVVLLGRRYSRYRFDVAGIWLMERSSDLLVLCLIVSLVRDRFIYVSLAALLWLCVIAVLRPIYRYARRLEHPQAISISVLLGGSLFCSVFPGAGMWAIMKLLGEPLGLAAAFDAFAGSTVFGYLTGLPSGVGLSGSAMVLALQGRGADLLAATAGTLVYRGGTVWFAVALGIGAALLFRHRLLALLRSGRAPQAARPEDSGHFDAIAAIYDEELPVWIRQRLLARKVGAMRETLFALRQQLVSVRPEAEGLRGLDIGCGQGWHACELARLGYRMSGIDNSEPQLLKAAGNAEQQGVEVDLRVAAASALPFADCSFDFAYAINIFHHLTDPDTRSRAFAEVVRVLRPGGVFFLQEINTTNWLFRIYMGYLYPLIRGIDEGTERWILPDNLPPVEGAEWSPRIDYFTFLPDFVPSLVMRLLLPLERALERSSLRRYSAHYVARLQKPGEASS